MKLYSGDASPFAARVRLAIYAHDLAVDIVPSPADLSGPEYGRLTPLHRIPCLEMKSGRILPESETILEYLADVFPSARLRPSDPEQVAQDRLLARLADLYVAEPGMMLRAHMDPRSRDTKLVDATFVSIEEGLGYLEHFMAARQTPAGRPPYIADCTLVSVLFLTELRDLVFGRPPSLQRFPLLSTYWQAMRTDPHVQRVVLEMKEGLKALFGIQFHE